VKRSEEIVEILEAYDLTGSYRAAAELAGCDHHTVARYVALREAGQPPVAREHRARPIDDYLDKIEELVARSNGRVRADVVHQRLVAMGFGGGERTTRRVVAEVKARLRAGQRRVFRPWVTEPGLWLQLGQEVGGTGARDPGSAGDARTCGAPGWPGPASAWSSRSGTAPCPRSWPVWTPPCAGWAGCRPTR
jgi:hypothetical protein